MNYATFKKAELIEMLNDKDNLIKALQTYKQSADAQIANYKELMNKLSEAANRAIDSAKESQKIAEGFQQTSETAHQIAEEAIKVAKTATNGKNGSGKKGSGKKNAPKPDAEKKQTYTTREEALTARYGDKEQRRQYILNKMAKNAEDRKTKASIYATARQETTEECRATGKWVPKSKWTEIYEKKVAKMMAEAGLE